jgi:predicted transcriptional regulator
MDTKRGAATCISDVMQLGVVAVSPELPISSFQEFLTGEEISGAPVVDENGVLQGVASKTDIVSFQTTDLAIASNEMLQGATVAEIMTRDALTVGIDESVGEVARKMVESNMHRVIVVESEQIRGIVTTFDLLKVLF